MQTSPRGAPRGSRGRTAEPAAPAAPGEPRPHLGLPSRPRPHQTRPPRARAAQQGLASPPAPLKMEVAAAGSWLRNARPPHGRAGPKLNRARRVPAPSEAGPVAEATRLPPLTHRPVAQDRDLPGLGLRHLGGLLSPGPTTSTAAAAAAPVQRSAAAVPGQSGIQGRGGWAGAAAWAPRSRAQPPGTALRPRPQTRPRDRHHRPSLRLASVPPFPGQRPPVLPKCAGGRRETFYFKGKK